MVEENVRTKLAAILEEMEARTHQIGAPAYRKLHQGLVLRVEAREMGYQLAIARLAPTTPSTIEEQTVLRDLAPLFAGAWHRTTNRRGNDGAYYNVSTIDYHR